MAVKEAEGTRLGPGMPAREALEKTRVASLLDEVRLEPGGGGHRRARQGGGRHEGIVQRVDEEGRTADARQELGAARTRPVVALVGEAVERRGNEAIVLRERPRPAGSRQVEK